MCYKHELKIYDSILIGCQMINFTPFYRKNKNKYCLNWIDSSTMERQKIRRKLAAQNKDLGIQVVNYVNRY